jgi:hypothetical protein
MVVVVDMLVPRIHSTYSVIVVTTFPKIAKSELTEVRKQKFLPNLISAQTKPQPRF